MNAKTKRLTKRIVLGVLVLSVVGAGLTAYLLSKPPRVWIQTQELMQATTPQERTEIVAAFKDRLGTVGESQAALDEAALDPTQTARQLLDQKNGKPLDETIEHRLTNRELIALVSESFKEWTAQRGYDVPAGINEPAIIADKGELAIVFKVSSGDWSQIFSGTIDLTFGADGMAHGQVEELKAGSLPVSIVAIGEMLSNNMPQSESQSADRIGEWLTQLEGFEFRPVFELKDRKRARVLAMKVNDDTVTMTMRVQDGDTYKRHNALLGIGSVAVTDKLPQVPGLPGVQWDGTGLADVPTTTD